MVKKKVSVVLVWIRWGVSSVVGCSKETGETPLGILGVFLSHVAQLELEKTFGMIWGIVSLSYERKMLALSCWNVGTKMWFPNNEKRIVPKVKNYLNVTKMLMGLFR